VLASFSSDLSATNTFTGCYDPPRNVAGLGLLLNEGVGLIPDADGSLSLFTENSNLVAPTHARWSRVGPDVSTVGGDSQCPEKECFFEGDYMRLAEPVLNPVPIKRQSA